MKKKETQKSFGWIFLLIFSGIGVITLTLSIGWGYKRISLSLDGVTTTGTVVDYETSISTDDGHTSYSYYPIVEFKANDGKLYKVKGSTGSSSANYITKQPVEVIYNPDNPYDAQLTDFSQMWLGPLVLFIFGFVFTVAGIGAYYIDKNVSKQFGKSNPIFQRLKRRSDLKIEAHIDHIETLGGSKGYIIHCQSLDKRHHYRRFQSDPIETQPSDLIIDKTVDVFINHLDKDDYFVDVSSIR